MIASSLMPGHLVRRIHQISTATVLAARAEKWFDLTPVQFAALDALRHAPGIDQARLAEAIAKDRATIGAVVDRLEQKKLIARAGELEGQAGAHPEIDRQRRANASRATARRREGTERNPLRPEQHRIQTVRATGHQGNSNAPEDTSRLRDSGTRSCPRTALAAKK